MPEGETMTDSADQTPSETFQVGQMVWHPGRGRVEFLGRDDQDRDSAHVRFADGEGGRVTYALLRSTEGTTT